MSLFDPVAWSALAEQPVLEIRATVFAFLAATHLSREAEATHYSTPRSLRS